MKRTDLLRHIARTIASTHKDHPIRIGIDGIDGVGKTFFADELVPFLPKEAAVIRASIDGFHNPRAVRHQRGRDSAEGYYRDSFDTDALIKFLLEPLGPNGTREYRTETFDYRTDAPIESLLRHAPQQAILLMDGVFLFQPKLVPYWDLKIFLVADFAITVPRAVQRDLLKSRGESEEELTRLYYARYVEGQKLYLNEARPKETADIVIDNTLFEDPQVRRETI